MTLWDNRHTNFNSDKPKLPTFFTNSFNGVEELDLSHTSQTTHNLLTIHLNIFCYLSTLKLYLLFYIYTIGNKLFCKSL